MIYSFSLQAVAVAMGLLWIAVHLPSALQPARLGAAWRRFPRSVPTGLVLLGLALAWWIWTVATIDLGEFSNLRTGLLLFFCLLGAAMLAFSREYLAVRGLAALLFLAADVVLDAAFLRDEPAKLVVVTIAYVWVVAGLIFLFSPYRLRDLIAFATASDGRFRALSWAGVGFGAALILLGLFVY